ncbi:MAG: MYXO-CTERM sorting domain-containing protein [Deltaproteobacteria bacterium]|nr:MYXO-CTERM sorting domain-containing protein [Deltaproteobacteria bacterium]
MWTGLLGLSLCVAACAPESDVVVSEIAVPGPWTPPARTLAISNPQYVNVVGAPRVTGRCTSTCPRNVWGTCVDPACTGQMSGTLDVQRYILGRWTFARAGGDFSCRRNSNPNACEYLSVHAIGRAIDVMIRTTDGTNDGPADNTLGDQIANWLIENAEYVGIQRVIWDGHYWSGNRVNDHFRPIESNASQHTNHIHVELSVDAAARRTRFFTVGAPPMTCPVVCYGNAAVRADCSFTDCAAMGQVCVPDPVRCAASEAPASVRNAGATIPAATLLGAPSRYQHVTPTRIFDTRMPSTSTQLVRSDGATSGPLTAMRTGTFSAFPGLPAGATGVWLNVTAIPQTEPGFLSVYPAGNDTDTSTVNYVPPQPRANATAIALGAGGAVTFRTINTSDVLTDLLGAFAPTGMGLRTIAPTRAIDTRASSPIPAGGRLTVTVGAPADARAAVTSVAVIPRGTAGFVSLIPCTGAAPMTSNINHGPTNVIANTVISAISDGQLCFQSSADVDLVVDVTGFLVDRGELSLQLINPLRALDTRQPTSLYTGRLGDGQIVEIPISTIPRLPPDARAVLVNLTSTNAAANGFVTAFPCGATVPNTSSMNFAAGVVGGSAAISSLASGRLCVFSPVRTHLIVDLLGVWVPTAGSTPTDEPPPPPEVPEDLLPPEDGGAPQPDATSPTSDGSAMTDASRDAGTSAPPAMAGCGCRTQPTRTNRTSVALAAMALALAASHRRRRDSAR